MRAALAKITLPRARYLPYYAVLWILILVSTLPFLFMVLGSFKDNFEILSLNPSLLPKQGFSLRKYFALFDSWPLLRNIGNSLIVSTVTTLTVMATSLLVGYSLAKFRFPGRKLLFVAVVATMMVPFETRLVPLYVLVRNLGLVNTYAGLVLPWIVSAFGIFLIHQFAIDSIPDELIEAARLDGASEFKILVHVIAPVMVPALFSLGLLTFINSWNDFLWPLISVSSANMFTVSVALRSLADPTMIVDYGMVLAGATLSIIPIVVLFIAFSKQMISAVMAGGSKET